MEPIKTGIEQGPRSPTTPSLARSMATPAPAPVTVATKSHARIEIWRNEVSQLADLPPASIPSSPASSKFARLHRSRSPPSPSPSPPRLLQRLISVLLPSRRGAEEEGERAWRRTSMYDNGRGPDLRVGIDIIEGSGSQSIDGTRESDHARRLSYLAREWEKGRATVDVS